MPDENGQRTRIEAVAENSLAKIIARYLALPTIGLIGWLISHQISSLETTITTNKTELVTSINANRSDDIEGHKALWTAQAKTNETIAKVVKSADDLGASLSVLSANVANNKLWSDQGIARANADLDKINQQLNGNSLFRAPPSGSLPPH